MILLLSCSRTVEDTALPSFVDRGIVATTVGTSFDVGSLAVFDPETGILTEDLALTSGDPRVTTSAGSVLQINAYHSDSLRVYRPGAWDRPEVELSLGAGSNPHGAAFCGDELWVTRYDKGDIVVYDASTRLLQATVELSAFDDGDGNPEPAGLVVLGSGVAVALNQLDREDGWGAAGGLVLGVDRASREVVRTFPVGPNPSIAPWPGRTDVTLAWTGLVYSAWGKPLFDGALGLLDMETGALEVVFDEALHARNVATAAVGADGLGLAVLTDAADGAELLCFDASSGTTRRGPASTAYWSSVAVDEMGRGVVAQRPGWVDAGAPGRLLVVDLASCVVTDEVAFSGMPPFSLAALEEE